MKKITELGENPKYKWQEPGFDLEKERKKMAIMNKRAHVLLNFLIGYNKKNVKQKD